MTVREYPSVERRSWGVIRLAPGAAHCPPRALMAGHKDDFEQGLFLLVCFVSSY